MNTNGLNLTDTVSYHSGAFPPPSLDYARLINPLLRATDALARFDQILKTMHNSEILLAPLRDQEAVISSRMEGTISTMDEILQYQAEFGDINNTTEIRHEVIETILYRRALNAVQKQLQDGYPLSSSLIKSMHHQLLSFGRGAHKLPGQFRNNQNYIGDRDTGTIRFIPISPEQLPGGIDTLFAFISSNTYPPLLRIALTHLELEALHPFEDGNGRVGRMLITLLLWQYGLITAPHFYISRYFEDHKGEYIHLMRETSRNRSWEPWCIFFLTAVEQQSMHNIVIASSIHKLYEDMKLRFASLLSSKWSVQALDYIFANPIFSNSNFTKQSGIPSATAARFTRTLSEKGLLQTVRQAAGQRSATYRFEPLMERVRV